jgi:hypothetical protein
MSNWQPIETAPKDGTVVLLFSPDADGPQIILAQWREYVDADDPTNKLSAWYDYWDEDAPEIEVGLTHWHSVPEPPK